MVLEPLQPLDHEAFLSRPRHSGHVVLANGEKTKHKILSLSLLSFLSWFQHWRDRRILLRVLKQGRHVSLSDVGGVVGVHNKHFDLGVGSSWLLVDKKTRR